MEMKDRGHHKMVMYPEAEKHAVKRFIFLSHIANESV